MDQLLEELEVIKQKLEEAEYVLNLYKVLSHLEQFNQALTEELNNVTSGLNTGDHGNVEHWSSVSLIGLGGILHAKTICG